MKKIYYFLIFILIFPIINFYLTPNLPDEAKEIVNELSKQNQDDKDFLKAVWNDLNNRFTSENKCWKNYYSRNYITDGNKLWELQGECLPCHQQNNLLRAYLIESKRFEKKQLNTIITICKEASVFHVYTKISLDGEIINIDQWGGGKDWKIPFGETIHTSEVCEK